MAIGSRLNSEIQALRQASVNAGQASSMLQIADGAMARTSDILTRMKTLTVQASSDQLGNTERGMLDTEYQALLSEIDRIALDTERSEEHTSELQSLMRISYAVFCLKKKTNKTK